MFKSSFKKITVWICSLAVICGGLCSCSSAPSDSFSYPISEMPEVLDPQIASSNAELTVVENCMEGLVRLDRESKVIPAAAESWDVSPDGRVYTFRLRKSGKWYVNTQNRELVGESFDNRVTAKDFVFAIERAVDKTTDAPDFSALSSVEGARARHSGRNVALGVYAKDDYTLVIKLKSKDSGFLKSLANSVFMPCNKEFFEATQGRYGRAVKYTLCNGAFVLTNIGDESVTFARNEEYSGEAKAKPSNVTLYLEEDEQAALEKFSDGTYDAMPMPDYYGDKTSFGDKVTYQSYKDTVWVLACNMKSSYGGSDSFRKALMKSVEIPTSGAPDGFTPANGIIPDICTAQGENYRKAAGKVQGVKKDVKAAVGFYESSLDSLGLESASFKVLCPDFLEDYTKLLVQSWQKNLGTSFAATIESLPLGELKGRVSSGDYTFAVCPLGADSESTAAFLNQFALSDNSFGYKSSTFNGILADGNSIGNLKNAEEHIVRRSLLLLPLLSSESYYMINKNISGIYFYAFGGKVNFVGAVRSK